jgi:ABC-2 type transport system permease protein
MNRLFELRLRQLRNDFHRGEKSRFALFLLLGLFFILVLGFFFLRIFGYLQHLEEFPQVFKLFVAEKLLTMVFMTLFSLQVLSALLASLDIFFLSRDLPFLFATPLSRRTVFLWKLAEVAATSSAMAVFFSLPVIFSFARYFAGGIHQIAAILIAYLLFSSCGVLVGVLFGLLIPAFFSVRRLQPILSVFSVVLISSIVVFLRLLRPERFLNPGEIGNVVQFMGSLDLKVFYYFPFAWMARAMTFAARHEWTAYLRAAGLLLAAGSLLLAAVLVLQRRYYLKLYDKLNKGGRGTYSSSWKKSPLPDGVNALWRKEIKTFLRTPSQWSQLLIIGALVVVFVINMKMIPLAQPAIKTAVSFLNLGLAVFIVAGLSSRFTFPSIPIEGPGMIHLVASPMARRRFFSFKFYFYFFPQLLVGLALFGAGDLALGFDGFTRLVGGVFILPAVFFLTTLALFFGVRIREISPLSAQHVIVSRQGISFMLWSMIYLTLCLLALARPVFLFYSRSFLKRGVPVIEIGAWFAAFVLINLLAAALLFRSGMQVWLQREF